MELWALLYEIFFGNFPQVRRDRVLNHLYFHISNFRILKLLFFPDKDMRKSEFRCSTQHVIFTYS